MDMELFAIRNTMEVHRCFPSGLVEGQEDCQAGRRVAASLLFPILPKEQCNPPPPPASESPAQVA